MNFYAPNPHLNEMNEKICAEENVNRLNNFFRKLKS